MGLIESIISAPGRRGSANTFDMGGGYREPDLSLPWPDEPAEVEHYAEAASELFLVASQNGTSGRGEPQFGRPFRSSDDNLALSEDGYLLNGQGEFVLGLPLDGEGRRIGEQPEILRINADSVAPSQPLRAPNAAAMTVIAPSRSVQKRAAAGGTISSATTRISPTVCRPMTVTSVASAISAMSSRCTGQPWP